MVYSNKLVSLLIPVEHLGVLSKILHHLVLKNEPILVLALLTLAGPSRSICLRPLFRATTPCDELATVAGEAREEAAEPRE